MKRKGVFYFSPTGNCKKIAEEIVKVFDKNNVDKEDITSFKSRKDPIVFENYSFAFFIFPIYAGDVPNVVKEYFKRLQGCGIPVSLIALWGNIHSSNALHNAQLLLNKQNFTVVSGAEIVAPHSYNRGSLQLALNRPNTEEILKIQKFALESINIKTNTMLFPHVKTELMARLPQRFIPGLVVKMIFDEGRCNKCGLCQKKCPTHAIDDNLQIDNKKCIRCLACIKYCNTSARSSVFRTNIPQRFLGRFQGISNKCSFYI